MYKLTGVTKDYQKGHSVVHALQGVDLVIEDGEWLAIQGPTGHGKSTLLQMLGGLDRPTAGSIEFDGHELTELREGQVTNLRASSIGFIFQTFNLIPTLNAQENVEVALVPLRIGAAERRERAARALEDLGLGDRLKHLPSELSGGQQQRVALARAVAVKPGVLLLDEPLSAVDAKVREELRTEIRRMQVQLGITTILVTHDQSEALSISDRVVVMNRGAIEEIGTPTQIYAEPRSAFTAGFIGAMNEIPVRIVSGANGIVERWGRRVTAPGAAGLPDGDLALLLVRPESLEPLGTTTAALNGDLTLTGQVEVQTFLGATTRLLLRELPGGADDGSALPPTQRLAVDVPSASAGQWPAGSEIAVRIPVAASRVITDRSAERRTRGVQ